MRFLVLMDGLMIPQTNVVQTLPWTNWIVNSIRWMMCGKNSGWVMMTVNKMTAPNFAMMNNYSMNFVMAVGWNNLNVTVQNTRTNGFLSRRVESAANWKAVPS